MKVELVKMTWVVTVKYYYQQSERVDRVMIEISINESRMISFTHDQYAGCSINIDITSWKCKTSRVKSLSQNASFSKKSNLKIYQARELTLDQSSNDFKLFWKGILEKKFSSTVFIYFYTYNELNCTMITGTP